jgi:hypothetical protein
MIVDQSIVHYHRLSPSGSNLCRSFKSQRRGHKLATNNFDDTAWHRYSATERDSPASKVLFFRHGTERVFLATLERHILQCRVVSTGILVVAKGEPAGQRLCLSVPNKCHKRRGGANTLTFPARLACHFQAHFSRTDRFTSAARRIPEGAYQRAAHP